MGARETVPTLKEGARDERWLIARVPRLVRV